MKGFKTLAFNALIIVAGALLPWIAGLDWTEYVSPTVAMVIVGVANMALRFVTTTAVGKTE